jgi:DNA-binding CsgD family transcriptional regulator
MNTLNGGPTASEPLSSEIELALRSLASKLQALTYDGRPDGADATCGDIVLLDVILGDVRLLALRLRRPSPISLLSPREQEIARMVAQGYANKTIASVLEISSWTVASHLRRIFVKLQVSSRAAMATSLLGAGGNELRWLLDEVLTEGGATDTRPSKDEACLHSVPADNLSLTVRLWPEEEAWTLRFLAYRNGFAIQGWSLTPWIAWRAILSHTVILSLIRACSRSLLPCERNFRWLRCISLPKVRWSYARYATRSGRG